MHDDEIIGVKSTSIKFKNNVKVFVGYCYGLFTFLILVMLFIMEINKYLFLLSIPFIISLIYQMKLFKATNSESCLAAFKNNNLTGFLVFILIFSFNFI